MTETNIRNAVKTKFDFNIKVQTKALDDFIKYCQDHSEDVSWVESKFERDGTMEISFRIKPWSVNIQTKRETTEYVGGSRF